MGLRYRRRISAGPFRLNLSKSGVSTSIKLGNVTVNPKRRSVWMNLPGGLYYQKSYPHHKVPRSTVAPSAEWKATAIELVRTKHGKLWHDVPPPPRWHSCQTWTVGKTWDDERVDYCRCGAIRMNNAGPWLRRNSRRVP